jgi:hypothetical protein
VLLALARGGALSGVSIYDASGALRRTLRLSRQGPSTVFYRPLGPAPAARGGRAALLAAAEALEAAAGLRAPPGRAGGAGGGVGASLAQAWPLGGAGGALQEGAGAQQTQAAEAEAAPPDEGSVSRAAADLAVRCLGVAAGDLGGCWRGRRSRRGWGRARVSPLQAAEPLTSPPAASRKAATGLPRPETLMLIPHATPN